MKKNIVKMTDNNGKSFFVKTCWRVPGVNFEVHDDFAYTATEKYWEAQLFETDSLEPHEFVKFYSQNGGAWAIEVVEVEVRVKFKPV